MAAEADNIISYTYRGADADRIGNIELPWTDRNDVIVIVDKSMTAILREAFSDHPWIVKVICHEDVECIENYAFSECLCLRKVIIPNVNIVKDGAFYGCEVLEDVECDELEIIEEYAFSRCRRLKSIKLTSTRIVYESAFNECTAFTDVEFSSKLERIDDGAFAFCTSLERIIIPLKDGLITAANIFQGCEKLSHVDLVEGEVHEIIAALQLEEWRNDMNEEIDSINQVLPHVYIGGLGLDPGEKAEAIWRWIRSLLRKIIHYQAEHRRVLNEAATTLHHVLPSDISANHVLSFLELPAHTFELEEQADADESETGEPSEGEESEEDSFEERGEEDEHEDHREELVDDDNVGEEEDIEEDDEHEKSHRGRGKRQRL